MRRLLIFFLIMIMAVPVVNARRKKERAGDIKDNVYTDKSYGFKLTLNDDWNVKVQRKEDKVRLVLLKKRYETPADYIDAPDYTTVPRMVLFVDKVQLGAYAWIDSLLSETYDSESKKEAFKEFEILQPGAPGEREELVTQGRRPLTLDGERALLWEGQVRYMKEVAVSASSLGGKRVRGGYGGGIVAVKKDDILVAFHLITEWQYFEQNLRQALPIIESLEWGGKDGKKKK